MGYYTNVYLMRDGASGYYKIGMGGDPVARERTLLSQAPLIVLHSYWGGQSREVEQHLHEVFSAKRRRGEWFELNDTDVDMIFFFFAHTDRTDLVLPPDRLATLCRRQDVRTETRKQAAIQAKEKAEAAKQQAVQKAVTEPSRGIGSQYSNRSLRDMRMMIESVRQQSRQYDDPKTRATYDGFAKGIIWASGVD